MQYDSGSRDRNILRQRIAGQERRLDRILPGRENHRRITHRQRLPCLRDRPSLELGPHRDANQADVHDLDHAVTESMSVLSLVLDVKALERPAQFIFVDWPVAEHHAQLIALAGIAEVTGAFEVDTVCFDPVAGEAGSDLLLHHGEIVRQPGYIERA